MRPEKKHYFEQIESGVASPVPLSLEAVFAGVTGLFDPWALAKGVDIASFVDKDVPVKITGDPVRLFQVLSHLVENGLKFTEAGYVAVSVRVARQLDTDHVSLEFSVTDTGAGIAGDALMAIVETYSQKDQIADTKNGAQMDLSTCNELISGMGGHMNMESVLHKGSRVYFEIPARVVEAAPAVMKDCISRKTGRAMVALVAVDGVASRQAVVSYLAANNVVVRQIDQAEISCVDLAQADAVFAGHHTVKALPENGFDKGDVRVIVVAQSGDANGKDLVADHFADDIIMRPVGRREIYEVVRDLVNGADSGPPTAQPTDLPVFDLGILSDLRGVDNGSGNGADESSGLLYRVLDLFQANAPASFEDIRKVSVDNDMAALGDAVHGLKSMCANIGAVKAADACGRLELAVRLEQDVDIGAAIAEISVTINEVLNQIKQLQTE